MHWPKIYKTGFNRLANKNDFSFNFPLRAHLAFSSMFVTGQLRLKNFICESQFEINVFFS